MSFARKLFLQNVWQRCLVFFFVYLLFEIKSLCLGNVGRWLPRWARQLLYCQISVIIYFFHRRVSPGTVDIVFSLQWQFVGLCVTGCRKLQQLNCRSQLVSNWKINWVYDLNVSRRLQHTRANCQTLPTLSLRLPRTKCSAGDRKPNFVFLPYVLSFCCSVYFAVSVFFCYTCQFLLPVN